jgi:uncharacterized Fe-S cluster protein YjdI
MSGERGEQVAAEGRAAAPPAPSEPNVAPDLTRRYEGAGVEIQWFAARCIHSANCLRALPEVFDSQRRPWVDATAASADEIAAAVRRCPSGALHFRRADGGEQEAPDMPTALTPVRNGPLYARGDLEIRDFDGRVLRRDTRAAMCRCGQAAAMPFCDNTCRASQWEEPRRGAHGSGSSERSAPSPTGG